MSHDYINTRVKVYPEDGAALTTNLVDFSSTGVKAVMNFGRPIEVVKMGIVFDNSVAVTLGSFSIALQKYLQPGLATGLVALGSITPISGGTGSVIFNKFQSISGTSSAGADGSTVTTAPRLQADWQATQSNKFIVIGGQQLVWNVTVAATSGKGQVFVEYVDRPLTKYDNQATTNPSNLIEVTA